MLMRSPDRKCPVFPKLYQLSLQIKMIHSYIRNRNRSAQRIGYEIQLRTRHIQSSGYDFQSLRGSKLNKVVSAVIRVKNVGIGSDVTIS